MTWLAFRQKRGSLFIGRRIEQAIGNLRADYVSFKIGEQVDAVDFMPHEEVEELSYEEMRMKEIEKKKSI